MYKFNKLNISNKYKLTGLYNYDFEKNIVDY
jgi:hypothetical protein